MKYTRRDFLGAAAAGAGALMLKGCAPKTKYYDPYDMVKVGKSGIVTTRLSMGTGYQTRSGQSAIARMDFEQARLLIRAAYERGVRMFDVADRYGTHNYIGQALKDFPRSEYTIFTKHWFLRGNNVPEGVRPGEETEEVATRFLKELGTDYIDSLLLHFVTTADWNTQLSDYMTALSKLKQKGIIRSHGISCHSLPAIETAINDSWVETVHVRINPYGMNMDDTVENVEPIVKRLHEAGKGVVGMKLLGEGKLVESDEQIDHCISYALQLEALDVLTIGFENVEQIEDCERRIRKVEMV